MSSNQRIEFPELVNKILENVIKINQSRYFIAISGAPASGKSTISEKLKSELILNSHKSSVLQMDGFHLDNNILEEKKLIERKGAPETFDVLGLLNCLLRLKNESEVIVPIFDRSLELSRSSALVISENTKIIIVEGNYLLLDQEPWRKIHNFFDTTIMIDCNKDILEKRLIERWESFGLSNDQIKNKVYKNDLPNGLNVISKSISAEFNLIN